MSFREKLAKLKRLESEIGDLINETLSEHSKDMADLNRKQLAEGKDATGATNPKYKSKGKRGPLKFRETGDYYKSIVAEVKGTKVDMKSTDAKAKYLDPYKGHGTRIETLGLSPDSITALRQPLTSTLIEKIKNFIS